MWKGKKVIFQLLQNAKWPEELGVRFLHVNLQWKNARLKRAVHLTDARLSFKFSYIVIQQNLMFQIRIKDKSIE